MAWKIQLPPKKHFRLPDNTFWILNIALYVFNSLLNYLCINPFTLWQHSSKRCIQMQSRSHYSVYVYVFLCLCERERELGVCVIILKHSDTVPYLPPTTALVYKLGHF